MKSMNTRHRVGALMGAVALGLTVALGTGLPASAATQDYGNIDPDREGSLTVHKFLHQAGTHEGDPSAPPADGDFSNPVADVEFTIYPLLVDGQPIDVTKPASWVGLKDLVPGAACTAPAGMTLGAPVVMPLTDGDGASTQALPLGVYQVCETNAPSNIIEKAKPFIVAVPMPHDNGWVYDVHAYPKNAAAEVVKTIDPQTDFGLGSVVKFPVTVPVPRLGDAWTGFGMRDTLDDRLAPVDTADVTVTVDGVAMDPSYYTVVNNGQLVTFNMTAAGLAWLNEGPNAHVGAEITVTFAGTVQEIGDGTIPNTAIFYPNNPGFDPAGNPPLPSNEVRTYWGNLEILKRAAGTTGTQGALDGAVFEIYAAVDPYAADCSTAQPTGDPIAVKGETSFTSTNGGIVAINGLFVSDSENPVKDATQRCYVLKETAAPAGYVLPTNPYTPVTVLKGATTSDNIQIENNQHAVPELPLTGAAGQLILTGAAVAAMGIAFGLILMRRKAAKA